MENLEPNKIDPRTDWGKGIYYKTCDGKEVATMEEVLLYNLKYYFEQLNQKQVTSEYVEEYNKNLMKLFDHIESYNEFLKGNDAKKFPEDYNKPKQM